MNTYLGASVLATARALSCLPIKMLLECLPTERLCGCWRGSAPKVRGTWGPTWADANAGIQLQLEDLSAVAGLTAISFYFRLYVAPGSLLTFWIFDSLPARCSGVLCDYITSLTGSYTSTTRPIWS